MSDRCYMEITCRAADVERFTDIDFHVIEEQENGLLLMVDEEANYGHVSDIPKDLVYFGFAGAGGSYDACAFACDGQTYLEVLSLEHDDAFGVSFNGTGEPKQTGSCSLEDVKGFIQHRNKVKQTLGLATPLFHPTHRDKI
jgi:hypothetical protein